MEKYSVLMSLYKSEDASCFKLALESMLNQTVPPDEIVLVEDGPLTEELYAVIEQYKDNLVIVKNKSNLGLGLALRRGVKACKNELIARMDTDDIAVENRCEMQLNYLVNNREVSIVGGQIEEFVGEISNIVGKRVVPCSNQGIYKYMKKRCPFNHMTVMFRKSSILKAGNYKHCFWNEDYYLWIRMYLKQQRFANLPDTLVLVRTGEDMYQRRGGIKYFKSELFIQ